MSKITVIVFADKETHEGLGRIYNALETVKEAKKEGIDVQLIFDGAGTVWIPELENKEHIAHPLYSEVKDKVTGACDFCAKAFGVKDEILKIDINLLDQFEGHPSIAKLVKEGYQIITF